MERIRQRFEGWALACAVVLTVVLGHAIRRFGAENLPQLPGENVLALVLGDARQQVSQLFFDKVEEYYHGGVRNVVCQAGVTECAHDHDHDDDHGPADEAAAAPVRTTCDPWVWLDARVHAQEHRHLEHAEATELLPWVWAACRASPKNIQAFLAGSYVLSRMVGKPEEGVRLLEEGVRKNPGCAELHFSLGELLLNRLREPARAEAAFLSALTVCHPEEGASGEEARLLKLRTVFYLGYLANQRNDVERLRFYVKEADALNPAHVCAKNLRALLRSVETTK